VGQQLATLVAGEFPIPGLKQTQYRHNVRSMKDLWRQVGEGDRFEVGGGGHVLYRAGGFRK